MKKKELKNGGGDGENNQSGIRARHGRARAARGIGNLSMR